MLAWFWFLIVPVIATAGFFAYMALPEKRWGRNTQRDKATQALKLLIVGVVLFFTLAALSQGCGYKTALDNSIEERTFTLEHLERGTDDQPSLAYTSVGVFSFEDSLWLWKFDTSDRYGKMQAAAKRTKTFHCTVAGWRVRFLSSWESILDCDEWR